MVTLHKDRIVVEIRAIEPLEEWRYLLVGLARAMEVSTYSQVSDMYREEIGLLGPLLVEMVSVECMEEGVCDIAIARHNAPCKCSTV
ncbi:MAG: hypothetical protein MUE30_19575 [Spirosomaceae bacterium]|jgi:hypothetical protein|nr:hypothetical protein [Spirosomataceae bacterium]